MTWGDPSSEPPLSSPHRDTENDGLGGIAFYSGEMQLEIVSDTVCPWCLIGKRRFEAARTLRPDLEIEVTWRPFQLNPGMPAGGMDRKDYLDSKFGGADGAERIYENVRAAGRAEDIPFAFDSIKRVPNTLDSHRLIRWAGVEGKQEAVVEALFRLYFIDGADIGDHAVLAAAAAEAGMESEAVAAKLASDEDLEQVRSEADEASRMGVTGVPCFIFERRYAVSGAQEPAVFLQAFEALARSEVIHIAETAAPTA